jgi:DNA-binding SARP family transcriptional activator
MATKGELPPERPPSASQISWYMISKLLKAGQYERAAELLHEANVASKQTGDAILADILATTYHLSLACSQCQAEVAWHQKAHTEAVQRELELKQQLLTILDSVSSRGLSETPQERVISPAVPTADFRAAEHDEPESEKRFSLWQWTQKLLGRKPGPQSVKEETVVSSIKTLATSPAQEIEEGAEDFSGKAEILPPPSTEELETPAPLLTEEPREDTVLPVQDDTEPVDISSIKEAALFTAEAEEFPIPLIEEIDTSEPFSLPPNTAEPKSFVDEIMRSTADEASLVIDEKPDPQGPPTLVVYCLGSFRVYQDDQPIQDWKSSKGKAIFKYLVVHRGVPIAKEVLMDLFWPDSTPDAARNNLNVAIYGLRQTLRQTRPDLSHILFQDDHYLLKPELQIWVDVEAFMEHVKRAQNLEQHGELTLAIQEYRAAEALYQGEFLGDDRYEDWPVPQRQRLEANYFSLLDRLSRYYLDQEDYDACATMCKKMLAVDPCREEAHRRLMRYYSQLNQRYLALRQYHWCVEALANELDVGPSQTTMDLYEQIRRAQ